MRVILAVGILVIGGGCAHVSAQLTYSAGPTHGTVLDAETKQPIAGAIVVAQWVLEGGMHWGEVGLLKIGESATDESGVFRIEEWGPLPRPSGGVLDGLDPTIVIFKSGYRPWGGINPDYLKRGPLDKRDSVWNGKTITLNKVGSASERHEAIIHVQVTLSRAIWGSECGWKHIPRAIKAQETAAEHLKTEGRYPSVVSATRLIESTRCGSSEDFKRAYDSIR